jgi:hypothetical protein
MIVCWPDKPCRESSWLQLPAPCVWPLMHSYYSQEQATKVNGKARFCPCLNPQTEGNPEFVGER